VHALSSLSTVLNSLGSLARVLLITGVDKAMGVTGYHSEEGIQLMVSRLRMMCLGLGILSTVMGCAATPPSPVAPPLATLPPTAPSAVAPLAPPPAALPPAMAPLPYVPPSSTTGRPDVYQPSPYERKMDEEEFDYRRRRSTQEQEQEQRYQQWQQERARERDPRYEWMR
jgi:hypothetical protein